ncbi:MAG: ABC transporter permease, partial [Alphaproteobacteria bacterium]|nr:ABC transporter permease [Alphaproteobacteria bacterium]
MLDIIARFANGRGFWPAIPAVAFLTVLMVIPLVLLLSFGFSDIVVSRGVIVSQDFTLDHLTKILGDRLYLLTFQRSINLSLSVTALCLIFGFPVAYLYLRSGTFARRAILIAVIAPLLTSGIVRTYAWIVILGGQRGIVNRALLDLGLIDAPMRILNTHWAVLIGMTQVHLPLMILPLIAVMTRHDKALDEASANLGASRLQTLRHVILPMSVPGIGTGATLVFTLSYTTFVVPQLLGGGNYLNAATMAFEQMVYSLEW